MTGADVLLISGEPHDPDVARLIICEVPAARALTRYQNSGGACVWCGERDGLVSLGGAYGWKPHGCASCRRMRFTYVRAFLAWRRHTQACEPCRTVWCPDGWSYALAHEVAYEVAGKKDPVYCACGCGLSLTSRRLRPYTENTIGGPRYSHTGPCRVPQRPTLAGSEAAQ